ncbi:MAG: hypothetical protein Kow0069_08910 [Promethearchaeota archaeon]
MTSLLEELKAEQDALRAASKQTGVVVAIDEFLCTGCGLCANVCPFGLPRPTGNHAYQVFEPERCVECSACKRNCPADAVVMEERQGCGCLWDARARRKGRRSGASDGGGCCGPDATPAAGPSRCC